MTSAGVIPEAVDFTSSDRVLVTRQGGVVPRKPWLIFDYDTKAYPFAGVLSRDLYKVQRLGMLHRYIIASRERKGIKAPLGTADNLAVRQMMQNLPDDSPFYKLYRYFMLQVLSPMVGRALSYSSHPKMRVHLPETASVSSFHHDIIVTKRIDQINFWLPLVDLDGGATLWLESDYGLEDYHPVSIKYGQVLIFDGGFLGHGTVRNNTDTTRVSLDMRFSLKGATTRAEGVALMNLLLDKTEP